jgi:all-trans-8'-apo-beta-carotenal 15,15'-oxygenase
MRLSGGRAAGAARTVRTAGLEEELRAGKILHGDAAPWLRRLRNAHGGGGKRTPNTHVLPWQGRLLALNEGGGPVEVSPDDLETLGETDLGGVIQGAFCAHPHRVAAAGITWNIGLEYGPSTRMHIYKLPDAGPARRIHTLGLPYAPLVHDFAATESHLVFFISPVRINMLRHLLQLGGFSELFDWRPRQGTEVVVMPVDRPQEAVRFTVEPFFQWHFANAFHQGDEIVIDYVRFEDLAPLKALRSADSSAPFRDARCHRAFVDPKRKTFRSEALSAQGCEFPRVHPEIEGRQHRALWLVRGDLRAIIGLDPETGRATVYELPAGQWASEPVFVPRPGTGADRERDGYLMTLCHDDARDAGMVMLLDAQDIGAGPVARVWFRDYVTPAFHGHWVGRGSEDRDQGSEGALRSAAAT